MKTTKDFTQEEQLDLFKVRLSLGDYFIEVDEAEPDEVLLGDTFGNYLCIPTDIYVSLTRAFTVRKDSPEDD